MGVFRCTECDDLVCDDCQSHALKGFVVRYNPEDGSTLCEHCDPANIEKCDVCADCGAIIVRGVCGGCHDKRHNAPCNGNIVETGEHDPRGHYEDDRDNSAYEFGENDRGERMRERWAEGYDENLNGAPEGDDDR
jgi:hypothetical protein